MKIYEKPLAKIEKILVEDVITTSTLTEEISTNEVFSNDPGITDIVGGGAEKVIVFEW